MIKLKQILSEGKDEISTTHCLNLIKSKEFIDVKPYIFRGEDGTNDDKIYIKNIDYTRISRDTKNIYNLLFSNLPSWSQYPKRNKSHICATSQYLAENFGNRLYHILIKDNIKIGICPKEDLWHCFDNTFHNADLNVFDNDLKRLLDFIIKNVPKYNSYTNFDTDYNQLSEMLFDTSIFDTIKKWNESYRMDYSQGEYLTEIIDECKEQNISLLEKFDDILSPKRNGFRLVRSDFEMELPSQKEIWFEEDALFIEKTTYNYFITPYLS